MDWHCHAMSVLGVRKLESFLSNRPVDEAAAFIIPCCVCGYPAYQRMWPWTPFVGEIATTVRDTDNASDRYAEYRRQCSGCTLCCPCTPWNTMCNFSNSASFPNFALKFMQTLFLI